MVKGKKKKNKYGEVVPDTVAGPFCVLLRQLEGKLAWANILISILDFLNTKKPESFHKTFIAATLAWVLGLWLSSIKLPDGHYLKMSVMLLLLPPPQAMALLVHRPRRVKLIFF